MQHIPIQSNTHRSVRSVIPALCPSASVDPELGHAWTILAADFHAPDIPRRVSLATRVGWRVRLGDAKKHPLVYFGLTAGRHQISSLASRNSERLSKSLPQEEVMPTVEAQLRRDLRNYAVELRQLAYSLPEGLGEHDLLRLSGRMRTTADQVERQRSGDDG